MMRNIILLALVVISVASCRADGPRTVSAAKIKRITAALEALADDKAEAYKLGDVEAALELYTDDIVHHDGTFVIHLVGIDEIGDMISSFMSLTKGYQVQFEETFIGSKDRVEVFEASNISLLSHKFTQDDPYVEVSLLETRGDRISYWTIFYGLNTLEQVGGGGITGRLDEIRSLLSSYGSAWSSGNPEMVGGLYAVDAVREDSLFQEHQEGQAAIISFAESFFTWYPDAQWNLVLPFGDGRGTAPVTGGVYAVTVNGTDDQPCEVLIAVLLVTSEGQIVQETLYYEPDSLITCGWAN